MKALPCVGPGILLNENVCIYILLEINRVTFLGTAGVKPPD